MIGKVGISKSPIQRDSITKNIRIIYPNIRQHTAHEDCKTL